MPERERVFIRQCIQKPSTKKVKIREQTKDKQLVKDKFQPSQGSLRSLNRRRRMSKSEEDLRVKYQLTKMTKSLNESSLNPVLQKKVQFNMKDSNLHQKRNRKSQNRQ